MQAGSDITVVYNNNFIGQMSYGETITANTKDRFLVDNIKIISIVPDPPIVEKTVSGSGTTMTITGLLGEPKFWALESAANVTLGSTRYVVAAMGYNSTTTVTYCYRATLSGTAYYSNSYLTATYSDGTLTLKTSSSTNGGNFTGNYRFIYVY